MMSKPVYLPSLNALRAFEATARHRSVSKAASQLNVTQGAVSRHIKTLEEALGLTLLIRGTKQTVPTAEGIELADTLSTAFALIRSGLDRLKPGPLTLSCSSSITVCWLLPRMPGFYAEHPDIELKLDMNYDQVDFARDNISIAIRNSVIKPPRAAVIRDLGAEWIGPVCSPDYLRAKPVAHHSDLADAILLKTMTRPNAWTEWFSAIHVHEQNLPSARSFQHFYEMIQAAACGLGMAVVPQMLALEELKSGRLVAPLGFVPGQRSLSLWIAPHLASRSDMKQLAKWLTNEMSDPAHGVA
jgi:LysR family transcriptional regulator, glycine cleavage system transcriptional activator